MTIVDQREVGGADRGQRALVYVDGPAGHQIGVHRHVACDLELAQQCAHQTHDRGIARGARQAQVELHVELEEEVLVGEEVVGGRELALALDGLGHQSEVVLGGVDRGQLGHARLEQPPGLQDPGDLTEADLLARFQQLARNQLGGHEDAARLSSAHLEHAGLGERLDRLAQRRPADAHLRRQVSLGGQAVAGMQVARLDLVGDLLDGFLERPARCHRLERAFRPEHGAHRLAASTRSSAWRSATSSGVRRSCSAVAIARSRQSMAPAISCCSDGPPRPAFHSAAT